MCQECYDLIIIEKQIETRRRNSRENYWRFYEQFLCDGIPEIHVNLKDFQLVVPSTLVGKDEDKKNKEGSAPTTTPTTTLSGAPAKEQIEGLRFNDEMDVDDADDDDQIKMSTKGTTEHAASDVGLPDDGKVLRTVSRTETSERRRPVHGSVITKRVRNQQLVITNRIPRTSSLDVNLGGPLPLCALVRGAGAV